ncbi:MAG TPA: cytidine deaminase [Mycobacteriales bacterium]|nr:cytidine deaminase [Mycobacteriales bacterium]
MTDPGPDATLAALARAAQQRAYAPYVGPAEGAAVRDVDGRTYVAATVEHADADLTTSALRAAVVAAVSSGARKFESAVLVTSTGTRDADVALLREFGPDVVVHVVGLGAELA